VLRTLLQKCVEKVGSLTILDAKEHVENEARYQKVLGYEWLRLKVAALG
jgi:hypothetical protein